MELKSKSVQFELEDTKESILEKTVGSNFPVPITAVGDADQSEFLLSIWSWDDDKRFAARILWSSDEMEIGIPLRL